MYIYAANIQQRKAFVKRFVKFSSTLTVNSIQKEGVSKVVFGKNRYLIIRKLQTKKRLFWDF